MAKRKKTRGFALEGLIHSHDGAKLRPLWRAFATGGTWERLGRASTKRARYRHKAYAGRLRLAWWGAAIKFWIEDPDNSGRIGGAFVGHVQRHGRALVDRVDLRIASP
jgi:hypothetical protein